MSPNPSPVLGGLQGQEESSQDKSSPWSHLATPPRHSQSWKSWPESSSYGPKLLFIVSSFYPYEQDTFPAGLWGTLPRLLLETNDADVLICDQAFHSGCTSLSEQPVKHAADSWRLIHTSTMTYAAVKTQREGGAANTDQGMREEKEGLLGMFEENNTKENSRSRQQ